MQHNDQHSHQMLGHTQELISAGHVPITRVKFQETTAVMQINEKN